LCAKHEASADVALHQVDEYRCLGMESIPLSCKIV
jgi:hypothetical protein